MSDDNLVLNRTQIFDSLKNPNPRVVKAYENLFNQSINKQPADLDAVTASAAAAVAMIESLSASIIELQGAVNSLQQQVANLTNDDVYIPPVDNGTFNTNAKAMITSTVSLVNYAGGGGASITNAPVGGNPTKWVAILDNNTIRYIPTW